VTNERSTTVRFNRKLRAWLSPCSGAVASTRAGIYLKKTHSVTAPATRDEERRATSSRPQDQRSDDVRRVGQPYKSASKGGSNDFYNQMPVKKVTIATPFAVGKFAVTFAEWDLCVSAGNCKHKPGDQGWGRRTRPVIDVKDATKGYLPWLSRNAGKTYRLHTEAEWEYLSIFWGAIIFVRETPTAMAAAAGGTTSRRRQWVRSSQNTFGLYDMRGNVAEG
jgi:formylglycine-generating enzyme required for sulfatase activity